MKKLAILVSSVTASLLIVAACGGAQPTATPPPTAAPTRAPTATAPPAPTATTSPAATPRPTTAATAAPTAAPTATPRPTATAAPTATPAPAIKRGGVFNQPGSEPAQLDFHLTTVAGARPVAIGVYSLLIRPRLVPGKTGFFDYVADPDLAERWEQTSSTALTFYLNKSAKFQNKAPVNGRAVTADDVVWSIDRAIFSKDGALKGVFPELKSATKVDANTVKLELSRPSSTFIPRLMGAQPLVIAAKEVVDQDGDLKKTIVGSGPWAFKSWDRGNRIVLEKNPGFYQPGRPIMDGITIFFIADSQAELAAFKAGRLDRATPTLRSQVKDVQDKVKGAQVLELPTAPAWLFVRADLAPTNDVRVRQAISMAINRQKIITAVQEGEGEPYIFYHPQLPGAPDMSKVGPAGKYMEYRPDEAKALLKEAGYKGEELALWNTERFGTYSVRQAEAITEDLRQVGINVKNNPQEYATFISASYAAKYQHFSLFPRVTLPLWDQYLVDYLRTGGRVAVTLHGNQKLDDLIDQASAQLDDAKRVALIREALMINLEQNYIIPLVTGLQFGAYQPHVRGVVPHYGTVSANQALLMTDVWLDK